MVCKWLREICNCSWLPVPPGPAWVLLSKIYRPFLGALYISLRLEKHHYVTANQQKCSAGNVQFPFPALRAYSGQARNLEVGRGKRDVILLEELCKRS